MERKFPNTGKLSILTLLLFVSVLGWSGGAFAQSRSISGTVVSSLDNQPLIGVAVVAKGTSVGSSTGANGEFALNLPAGVEQLTVSFLGYTTRDIDIAGRTQIQITLDQDNKFLDEVVVIGYGVQKKKLTTGANLNVKGDDILKRNTTGALQALQGMTPGVQITSNSGQPGEGMKVTIRGLGTTGSSGPLYIVDGVPGDITKINPSDIESLDVLKDAASAAIYGSQAANGVILVTTKGGVKGTASVYYDGYYGVQTLYRQTQMLNASQYKTIMDEQALNSGAAPYDWSKYGDANTNWVGQMFRSSAPTQNHTVGVSGGGETSTYILSFNYTDQQGMVGNKEKSDYKSYRFRINTEHKLYKDILKVGQHLAFVHGEQAGIGVGNQYNNALRGAFNTSPLAPVYGSNYYALGDENGQWNDSSTSAWNNVDGNPYASMMVGRSITKSQNVFGDIYAELRPVKGLTIRSTIGMNYYGSRGHSFTPPSKWNYYGITPSQDADWYCNVSQNQSNGYSLSWINTASYETILGESHHLSALIGSQWDQNDGEWLSAGNKISVEQYKDFDHAWINNSASGSTYMSMSGAPNDIDRSMSFFARVGYNFKEKYLLNATFRADASSKFAPQNRWGFFPSVSAGWVVSEEQFLRGSRSLNFLKIRGSWGQVGNKNIGNYMYTAPIVTKDVDYSFGTGLPGSQMNQTGAFQERFANEFIKWETSEQLDFGFDARLLDNRFNVNFDWYRKVTKDWLVEAPIIGTAGTGAPFINGGDVTNMGVELALNWRDNIGEFNYYIGANGSYNHNSVGNIPNSDGIIHGEVNMLFDNAKEFYRAQNGHSIGYWWGLQTDGIFQNWDEIEQWRSSGNGLLQKDVQPGDVRFVDRDKNGIINDLDKVDLGNGMPTFSYGFTLGFDWRGLDFAITAYGVAGNKIVQSYRNHGGMAKANYTTAVLNRWTGEGTSTRLPRVTDTNINYTEFSDLFVQDGDYLRISNITLGYDFARIAKTKWLSRLRLYASVQNAFTFTKYDGMDPEIGYGTSGWCSGIDLGYYPHPRTYLVGANIKF